MALDTLLATALPADAPPPPGRRALVLMGGGARTAYQVGVLRALARLLPGPRLPFDVLVGTSAGALNATFVASCADEGLHALDRLTSFWSRLRSEQVYRLQALRLGRPNLLSAGLTLMRQVRRHRALLDSLPLVDTLHRAIDLPRLAAAIDNGVLFALGVTASSYTT
ncbi:patatin-like phospholipase family protein, partial [uncultured Tepidimonas sp.]